MLIQLTQPQWLQLPIPVRTQLKKVFGIPRSSGTVVEDNRVTTDGHTHGDLAFITVEKMQDFTHSEETDFFVLFEKTLAIVDGIVAVPDKAPETQTPIATPEVLMSQNGKMYRLVEVTDAPEPTKENAPLYGLSKKEAPQKAPVKRRGRAAKAGK